MCFGAEWSCFGSVLCLSAGTVNTSCAHARDLNSVLTRLAVRRDVDLIGRLPSVLQILGDGELTVPLKVHATQFSASARSKIKAAGGIIVDVPAKVKWTRALGKERKAAADAAPKPSKAEKASE